MIGRPPSVIGRRSKLRRHAEPTGDAVIGRIAFRLIPFLAALYFISYLDRVNIGFAALEMNASLKLSAAQYGTGAGIFFLGYLALQIPSNIMLQRYGARRWLAMIVLAWGIASLSMSFVQSATQFYIARFALGASEAGFFPGLVLYLTYWFPTHFRGRIMSGLLVSVPLATVFGAPISNFLLTSWDGHAGWDGWRWLFLIEAIPALVAAASVWLLLPDGPARVGWLDVSEKAWLDEQIRVGPVARERTPSTRHALTRPSTILFALVYFGLGLGLYGIGLWLPQIIKASGTTQSGAVLLTAIPYSVAAVAMTIWARIADRYPAHPRNTWLPALVCAIALALLPMTQRIDIQLVLLSFAAAGTLCAISVFWTLPTSATPPESIGVVVALVNTTGSLGGFAGPFAIGWLKDLTGGFSAGLLVMAFGAAAAAALLMLPIARPRLDNL